jgi:hypothetical protein
MSKRSVLTMAAVAGLVVLPPPAAKADSGNFKVDVCHIPPGNPANAHTINVSIFAVPAHLAHGDSIGQCEPTPTPTPSPTPDPG